MKLVLHGTAPTRVLVAADKSESFKSCQENRKGDEQRFKDLMVDTKNYEIVKYEDTAEGKASILENKKFDERMWRNNEIDQISFQINALEDAGKDSSALRAFRIVLRNYPQQLDFPNGIRPKL